MMRSCNTPSGDRWHHLAVALTVTACLAFTRLAQVALDSPNNRSLHVAPIPRLGGIGVLVGDCAELRGCFLAGVRSSGLVGSRLVVLAMVSLVDDLRRVPVAVRLAAHLAAAGWLGYWAYPDIGALASLIAALATAWMINLYQLHGWLGRARRRHGIFRLRVLWHRRLDRREPLFCRDQLQHRRRRSQFCFLNFTPARIFLGDVGAVPLGFLAAALGLTGWIQQAWTWWFPVLVFSPFIIDATLTLARRALRRERVWEAHFDHYYQRLVAWVGVIATPR